MTALSLSRTSAARLLNITSHMKGVSSLHRTLTTKQIEVFDGKINYIDTGVHGSHAVVFLHGNPTSSYLWRNIIPHVQDIARCVAPDLIGMGKSSKIDGMMYTFQEHFNYLNKWMQLMDLPEKVNLVIHDWGSALGFHWACLNPDRVASITHMESLVAPLKSWDDFPKSGRKMFQAFRTSSGEEMILKKNLFVELLLPSSIIRKLSEEELAAYIEPFKNEGECRRPTLTWPREIPIVTDGPKNMVNILQQANKWLSESSDVAKLYINADPGFFSPLIMKLVKDWPNQKIVTVKGIHFIQEDSSDEIGKAIKDFLLEKVIA